MIIIVVRDVVRDVFPDIMMLSNKLVMTMKNMVKIIVMKTAIKRMHFQI